jgi:hypothetical protein
MGDANEREEIRNALLADDDNESVLIEHKGKRIEIRAPTLEQQKLLRLRAKDPKTKETDDIRLLILGVMECAFVPGTHTKIFDRTDEGTLASKSLTPRSLMGKATKAISRLMGEKQEDIEVNFVQDPIGN